MLAELTLESTFVELQAFERSESLTTRRDLAQEDFARLRKLRLAELAQNGEYAFDSAPPNVVLRPRASELGAHERFPIGSAAARHARPQP